MNLRCPKCGSTLFHVQDGSSGQILTCFQSQKCGWSAEINPPLPVVSRKPKK
jgi:DNA-directed RNA polymerase subunit M/transcription elongation factor TFIIS